jgi:hypothetical protein
LPIAPYSITINKIEEGILAIHPSKVLPSFPSLLSDGIGRSGSHRIAQQMELDWFETSNQFNLHILSPAWFLD